MKNKQNLIIGIDLGNRNHEVCVISRACGEVQKRQNLRNCRNALAKLSLEYPGALIVMECGTHSPWMSRFFEERDHQVLVANARKLQFICQNDRKSDRNDAENLARVARLDPQLLHPIRHRGEEIQLDRSRLKTRETLVRCRANLINTVRGSLKSYGIYLGSCSTECFARHAQNQLQEDEPQLLDVVQPLITQIQSLSQTIKALEKQLQKRAAEHYPQTQLFESIPGVGPITALGYVVTVESAERLDQVRSVGAYLGMVPRRDQSGDHDRQLPISKAGDRYLRKLLVNCSHYILGQFGPPSALRDFGLRLCARGGKNAKKRAVVAVARKLSVIMLSMWKSQQPYQAFPQNNTN